MINSTKKSAKLLLLPLVALALGSCSYLSTQKTEFYSLTSPVPQPVEMGKTRSISIGVGPVDFPELLDRPQVITRSQGHAIVRSEKHYWGGSLEDEFLQVLADNLQTHLRTNQVLVYPWDNRHRPDYQLRGTITRFDGQLGGNVYLQARWQLMGSKKSGLEIIRSSHIKTQTQDESYSAYVSALSEVVGLLSEEITQCVLAPQKCK